MNKENTLFEDAHEFLRTFQLYVASVQKECYRIASHEDLEIMKMDVLGLAQQSKLLLRELKKLKEEHEKQIRSPEHEKPANNPA